MMNPHLLLAAGVIIFLLLAGSIALVGRALRSKIEGGAEGDRGVKSSQGRRDWAVTPLPTGVARTLTERGLVNAQQLASMSEAEREFFVATVAARVNAKPKLVPGGADSNGGQAAPAAPDTTAALVSGSIHCPVCRTLLGQRADTPLLMSRCPGCSRRVATRVEGNRLTVTVQYGPTGSFPVVEN